jgi:hypothetical protein
MSASSSDRAQAVPLVAVTLLVMALAAVAMVRIAGRADELARARTAADAAALAAVRDGRAAADALAGANGAAVVAYRADDTSVEITVRVGESTATARAELVVSLDRASPR